MVHLNNNYLQVYDKNGKEEYHHYCCDDISSAVYVPYALYYIAENKLQIVTENVELKSIVDYLKYTESLPTLRAEISDIKTEIAGLENQLAIARKDLAKKRGESYEWVIDPQHKGAHLSSLS